MHVINGSDQMHIIIKADNNKLLQTSDTKNAASDTKRSKCV